MRISGIRVQGLFDTFDHTIPMNLQSRITLIHGPNGIGKTRILKLLAALFSKSYRNLDKVPFQRLEIDFDDHRQGASDRFGIQERDIA